MDEERVHAMRAYVAELAMGAIPGIWGVDIYSLCMHLKTQKMNSLYSHVHMS
jgi:hypothetical protein